MLGWRALRIAHAAQTVVALPYDRSARAYDVRPTGGGEERPSRQWRGASPTNGAARPAAGRLCITAIRHHRDRPPPNIPLARRLSFGYDNAMSQISSLFVTRLYHAKLSEHGKPIDPAELETSCLSIAEDDEAGQRWCEKHGYPGYTSYASLTDLGWRFPIFKDLVKVLDKHVAAFVKELQFDLGDKKVKLDSLWINILPEGGIHTAHIHPHSVISGTTYVAMPAGASAIKFEDPRLAMMMAAPPRRKKAPEELRQFVYVQPEVGDVLLWESWLRHEVPMNMSEEDRISVSFNYAWG
jgi:uncharacterized protein (TIGR02466 family)